MDTASGPEVLGRLLCATAALPRSASTDALGTQAWLQVDTRALQSPELRRGLAAWTASVRHPGDADARAEDAARWEALLSDPNAQAFIADSQLPAEQRLRHVAFLLAWPEPRVDVLQAHAGDLTRLVTHELLLAVDALDPALVAPIVGVPAMVREHLPELTPPPENAGALAALMPDLLAPSRAAEVLLLLADDLERRLAEAVPGDAEPSAARDALRPLVELAASGLRAPASEIRAEPEDTQRAAQALVLGAMRHQLATQGLGLLAHEFHARQRGEPPAPHAEEQTRRELVASGAALIGTALASDVGAAVARMLTQATVAHWDRHLAAGRLPLGAQPLRAPGFSPVSLSTGALGNAVGELLRLYTSQLGDLGDEAFELLGETLATRLTSGGLEGLDAAWAELLDDLARMALLQDAGPDVRAQVLRVLLVGATLGLLSWEAVAPRLHARGPVFFGRTVAVDTSRGALPDVFRASAALAVTALADPFIQEDLRAGLLTPAQSVPQVRSRGESLLVDADAPVDEGLASALLAAMVAARE